MFEHRLYKVGEGMLVSFDYRNNRKAAIPDEIRQAITTLEDSVRQPPAGG